MATARDIEKDIETAVKAVIVAQLATDGIMGVRVDALTLGAPGEENTKPYIFVMCQPVQKQGFGGTDSTYNTAIAIQIQTAHLTSEDRRATNLINILGSVGYALDNADFTAQTARIGSLQIRRQGGNYDFEDSTNEVTIQCDALICGTKS
jgi:hypothetical protein